MPWRFGEDGYAPYTKARWLVEWRRGFGIDGTGERDGIAMACWWYQSIPSMFLEVPVWNIPRHAAVAAPFSSAKAKWTSLVCSGSKAFGMVSGASPWSRILKRSDIWSRIHMNTYDMNWCCCLMLLPSRTFCGCSLAASIQQHLDGPSQNNLTFKLQKGVTLL